MGFEETMRLLTNMGDDPRSKVALYSAQAVGSIGAFILVPMFYIKLYQRTKVSTYFSIDTRYWQPLIYVILITFCFMIVNSLFIEWNLNLTFPEFMSGFEQWAQAKEEQLKAITEYLTDFSGFDELLVALFVVAIIPGIGEELLFRGLIQTRLQQLTRNPHIAIWVAAIFFSAFHFQFYGFVPRMLLGALFGYIFYWSGSLVLAMLAHFFNNGFSLVMLYLYKNDLVDFNIDDTETVPLETVGFFFIIGAALTYLFIKFHRNLESADG
jgi:membrane protease YdiL (CAAX protease family)